MDLLRLSGNEGNMPSFAVSQMEVQIWSFVLVVKQGGDVIGCYRKMKCTSEIASFSAF